MTYCILTAGLPASGKSTIASCLSKELEISLLPKDSIKEIMFDTIGFDSHEMKRKLDAASTYITYYVAEKLMQNSLPFIIDNNFEHSKVEPMKKLIDRYCYDAITVAVDGDMDIFYDRYIRRNGTNERHRGHAVNNYYPEKEGGEPEPLIERDEFDRYVERGMRDFSIGKRVEVDTTDFDNVDYRKLLQDVLKVIRGED